MNAKRVFRVLVLGGAALAGGPRCGGSYGSGPPTVGPPTDSGSGGDSDAGLNRGAAIAKPTASSGNSALLDTDDEADD